MPSARRILADFKVFSRGYLRNIIGLFFGLIFPVVLILIFGAIFSATGNSSVNVYVQNLDTKDIGGIATSFVNALNGTVNGTAISDNWPMHIEIVNSSVNFADFLREHSTSNGIVIPENFSQAYVTPGENTSIIVYGSNSSTTSSIVNGVVTSLANQYNLNRVNGSVVIGITSASVSIQQTKYIDSLIPGLIGFSILVNPMFAIVSISADYKKTKLFKQLSLTPLTKMEWLTSKILFYILLSAISFLLMSAVGILAFGANIFTDIYQSLWLIPFLVLGPMMFCSLGMLVGTVSKSPETASIVGNIITFPMMFLAGTFFPISIMPEWLQTVAHVLPLYYVIEGLNNVMVYNNANLMTTLVDIGVVAVITAVFFAMAIYFFKWRED